MAAAKYGNVYACADLIRAKVGNTLFLAQLCELLLRFPSHRGAAQLFPWSALT
jgi:hypothetical protein